MFRLFIFVENNFIPFYIVRFDIVLKVTKPIYNYYLFQQCHQLGRETEAAGRMIL